MENNEPRKTFGQHIGEFINSHPWITFWSVLSLIDGVVTLVRGRAPIVNIVPETSKLTDAVEEATE